MSQLGGISAHAIAQCLWHKDADVSEVPMTLFSPQTLVAPHSAPPKALLAHLDALMSSCSKPTGGRAARRVANFSVELQSGRHITCFSGATRSQPGVLRCATLWKRATSSMPVHTSPRDCMLLQSNIVTAMHLQWLDAACAALSTLVLLPAQACTVPHRRTLEITNQRRRISGRSVHTCSLARHAKSSLLAPMTLSQDRLSALPHRPAPAHAWAVTLDTESTTEKHELTDIAV